MDSELAHNPGRVEDAASSRGWPRFSEIAANALRYWEPRRAIYNLALIAVVGAHVVEDWPMSRSMLTWNTIFQLIILAVLANVCYCAAYPIDLFVQYSGLRAVWVRWRWVLLLVGIIFAGVIAHFFTISIVLGFAAG